MESDSAMTGRAGPRADAELTERWRRFASGWLRSDRPLAALLAMYGQPHRAYHNQRHLLDCLIELDGVRGFCGDVGAVEAALWFHDCIYDLDASDNEERSAQVARAMLLECETSEHFIRQVVGLVLDTRGLAAPRTREGQFVCDIDLSVLGREPEAFDRYDRAIRQEYQHVPEDLYLNKRGEILRGFLERPRIYQTDCFHARLEERARDNLRRWLAARCAA